MSVSKEELRAAPISVAPVPAVGPKGKSAWADPQSALHRYGVVAIFGVTCLLLSLLILQQERVISTQRALIRQLFQDSQELNQIKIHNLQSAKPRHK